MKTHIGIFVLALFAPAIARADVISPNPVRDVCGGKKAGDACELDGKPGACKASKCKRTVGGVLNPSEIEEDCLVCDATAAGKSADAPTPTPTNVDTPKDDPKAQPTKEEPAKDEPAKEEPAKEEPAKEEPAKAEPTKAEPTKSEPAKTDTKAESKGGICSVAPDATPLASFAMGVLLLALARRRRRG